MSCLKYVFAVKVACAVRKRCALDDGRDKVVDSSLIA